MTSSSSMLPFERFPDAELAQVRVIVADIDHTVTTEAGKIEHRVVESWQRLRERDVRVLLVTGRAGGWAQALACYMPGIDAAIGENGSVAYGPGGEELSGFRPGALASKPDLEPAAERLRLVDGPAHPLRRTSDDVYRRYEITFERPRAWRAEDVARAAAVLPPDLELVASSIHLHVRRRGWNKAQGAAHAIGLLVDPAPPPNAILAVGDSANDASLFAAFHATSVGVANVAHYAGELGPQLPRYVTRASFDEGFLEVAARVIAARSR